MPKPLRIAMWSGPRNLSTAIMRSFSSRPDTAVLDEPFYAHYLNQTGIAHPVREQVIGSYETDWEKVIDFITGAIPGGKSVWYQKHMGQHMLPHIDLQHLIAHEASTHAFLIRDPAEVISSYMKMHSVMTLAETALPNQVVLFDRVRAATGKIPPVIDARDVLLDPQRTLSRLCQSLGLDFAPAMLHWPAGPHPDDGNWGPYWYASVYKSTGFDVYKPKNEPIPDELRPMLKAARNLYDRLAEHKL